MDEFLAELDACADSGQRVCLWLRDDDAVSVTPALERLIGLAEHCDVPMVLAVIPLPAEPALAERLGRVPGIKVALHGHAHCNHAPSDEKKQELGAHRPTAAVLDELARGRDRLDELFGAQAVPMLVPPWNRIAADLLPHLPGLGLRWLSTFGPEPPHQPVDKLLQVDCQLDIMDWRARRSHPRHVLSQQLAAVVRQRRSAPGPIGILTHHLVHDEAAWEFLAELFRLTARHEAVTWEWPAVGFES